MKYRYEMKSVLLLILISSGFLMTLNAQIPPITDKSWKLNKVKSDEFNQMSLDTTKWDALDPSNKIGYNWGGGQYFTPLNVCFDGNHLLLKVDKIEKNNSIEDKYFYSGGIQSVNHTYSYGYFEIRAKLPGFYRDTIPCGEGFWPAFWTYYVEEDENRCRIIHDEIDILEPSGSQYKYANVNVAGWHDEDYSNCRIFKVSGDLLFTHNKPFFEEFHKYALEWLPDRIIFYFDDKPFAAMFNHPKMKMKSQYVVIDLQIDGYLPKPYLRIDTPLPQYMTVDYFRYYEMDISKMDEKETISSNLQLQQFNQGIRKLIYIGNGTQKLILQNGENKTFRATDEIIINGEFTVSLGSELNLILHNGIK